MIRPLARSIGQSGGGNDGFFHRIQLAVYPERRKKKGGVDRAPDKLAASRAEHAFERLMKGRTRDHTKWVEVHFTPEAQKIFNKWSQENEQRGDTEPSAALQGLLGKRDALGAKLALLFEMMSRESWNSLSVGAEETRRAIAMCEYLEGHFRKIVAIGEDQSMLWAHDLAGRILNGRFEDQQSINYHSRRGWPEFDGKGAGEKLARGLEILERCGWVHVSEIATGGRHSNTVHINPEVFKLKVTGLEE
jgi:hypothetical protein